MTALADPAPPLDLEAEQAVLGAILVSERVMPAVLLEERLEPGHFYRERHRLIFDAMRRLYGDGEPVDVISVSDQLRRDATLTQVGGTAVVDALCGAVPSVANARRYATIVRDLAGARQLLAVSLEIQAAIHERRHAAAELIADAEQRIFQIGAAGRPTTRVRLVDSVQEELDRLQMLAAAGQRVPGLPTGYADLDELLGGLHPGNLVVLAARPAMGKTTAAANIAWHAAFHEEAAVLFCSLEMSRSELSQKYLAYQAGVDSDRLRKGRLDDTHWPALLDAARHADRAVFDIDDDSDVSIFELRARARELSVRRGGLSLVVVDYLQLLRPDNPRASRTEQVSTFARGLKTLAKELNCPVLALAQLNRDVEQRTDKRPLLSDLRESGEIEAAADIVAFLYRDDYYNPDSDRPGETELLVRKNRHGPLGDVTLTFQAGRSRFLPLAHAA